MESDSEFVTEDWLAGWAQEPEAEDEAEGWEIPQGMPTGQRSCTDDRRSQWPEDLVMGCMDPSCTHLFESNYDRRRCSACRLVFCERHISNWAVKRNSFSAAQSSDTGDFNVPVLAGGSSTLLPESLWMPCPSSSTGVILLCGACSQRFAGSAASQAQTSDTIGVVRKPQHPIDLTAVAAEVMILRRWPLSHLESPSFSKQQAREWEVVGGAEETGLVVSLRSEEEDDDNDSVSKADGEGQRLAKGSIVEVLGRRGSKLHYRLVSGDGPVQGWVDTQASSSMQIVPRGAEAAEGEDESMQVSVSRKIAQELMLQYLQRLRACLRQWHEHEREWVWRLREDLVKSDARWLQQFARQIRWDNMEEANCFAKLFDQAHARANVDHRTAFQVLSVLGRQAAAAAASLQGGVGRLTSQAVEAVASGDSAELVCYVETLLDIGEAVGVAGAASGRRAVVDMLLRAAKEESAGTLRNELFWALEARAGVATTQRNALAAPFLLTCTEPRSTWTSIALEELLRCMPEAVEMGLMRQKAWVRHAEKGEFDAVRVDPGWGQARAFPLVVWPPHFRCLGLEGEPKEVKSKSAPLILRCRYHAEGANQAIGSKKPAGRETAGLLLKRDSHMYVEQQVSRTLRLLEKLIWEDESLKKLLEQEGLEPEDVRATYSIVMTGAGTAMVEFVEDATTLREVREAEGTRVSGSRGALLAFLKRHNSKAGLQKALSRLTITAAISAMLSFVTGLGDRHHENFMVTTEGRLLHVDYGYSLGREPLDAVLIHLVAAGSRPAATVQYEELCESVSPELMKRLFWPVVRGAYAAIRKHSSLLVEMIFAALVKEPSRDGRIDSVGAQRTWTTAQDFVARRCVPTMGAEADRFIQCLFEHCGRHEHGTRFRDEFKGWRQQAMEKAYGFAGLTASAAWSLAADVMTSRGRPSWSRAANNNADGSAQ